MSRIYDNWEKLVGAVLRREKDRQLAYCESFSSTYSTDFSSLFSFDYDLEVADFSFNPLTGDVHVPAEVDNQMDDAESKYWDSGFQFFNDRMSPVSRGPRQKFDPRDPSSQELFLFRDVMAIEYVQLKKATKDFHPDMLLGEGGFGPVFKGWLHEHHLTAAKPGSGIVVAVKTFNIDNSLQGHEEWMNEINYLSELRHVNLVKLIGYNFERDNKILVYEFMPQGSLDRHLFTGKHQSLPWITRMKVALSVAKALAFLHSLEIPVIHRNVKSYDILLDAEFNAKLSDFGHAIDGPTGGMTHVETRVMGTYGYAAPEYVATGFKAIDNERPAGKTRLMEWVKPYLENKRRLLRIMDKRLGGKYPLKEAYKVGRIGLQCASSDPKLRPRMHEVVAALETL